MSHMAHHASMYADGGTGGGGGPPPELDSIDPANGDPGVQVTITCHGSGYDSYSRVFINDEEQVTTFVDASTVTATFTPAVEPTTYRVMVGQIGGPNYGWTTNEQMFPVGI